MKKGGFLCVHTLVWHKIPANEKKGGVCKTPHGVTFRKSAPPPPVGNHIFTEIVSGPAVEHLLHKVPAVNSNAGQRLPARVDSLIS